MDITKIEDLKTGFYWGRCWDYAWEPVRIRTSGDDAYMSSIGDDEEEKLPIPGLQLVGPLTAPAANWPEF